MIAKPAHAAEGCCRWQCTVTELCQGGQCVPSCTPTTCTAQGQSCDGLPDGCGNALNCGTCTCTPAGGTCEHCAGTTCEACDPCCDDVCCESATAICHAITGVCCVPDSTAQIVPGSVGMCRTRAGSWSTVAPVPVILPVRTARSATRPRGSASPILIKRALPVGILADLPGGRHLCL